MTVDKRRNLCTTILIQQRFLSPYAVQHSAGTDDESSFLQGFYSFFGHSTCTTRSDTDQCDLDRRPQAQMFDHLLLAVSYRNSCFCAWSADDDRCAATRLTGFDFLCKAAASARILGNQISDVIGAKHGFVQCFCKRSLHGDQVFAFKAQRRTVMN